MLTVNKRPSPPRIAILMAFIGTRGGQRQQDLGLAAPATGEYHCLHCIRAQQCGLKALLLQGSFSCRSATFPAPAGSLSLFWHLLAPRKFGPERSRNRSLIHSSISVSSAPAIRGILAKATPPGQAHTIRRYGRRSNCSLRRPGRRCQAVSSGQEELLWRGRCELLQPSLLQLLQMGHVVLLETLSLFSSVQTQHLRRSSGL